MANPSVASGVSLLDDADDNSFVSGTFGSSDGAIDSSDLGVTGIGGISGSDTAQTIENANGPATTSGNFYSARSPHFSSGVDISSANQAIAVHIKGSLGQFNRVDQVRLGLFSDSGTTEYCEWDIGDSTDDAYTQADYVVVLLRYADRSTDTSGGRTPESAGFTNTDVTGFYIAYSPDSTGNYGVDINVVQIVHIDGEVELADGDATVPGTFKRYRDLLYRKSAQNFRTMANAWLAPNVGFGHAVRVNSVKFSDSNGSFSCMPANSSEWFNVPSSGYYSVTVDPSTATAEHDLTDYSFYFSGGTFDINIDGTSLTTGYITYTRVSFNNGGALDVSGSAVTLTNCTSSGNSSVSFSDATVTGQVVDGCTGPVTITSQLASGASITITNPVADALQFDFDCADDSGRTYTVPAGSTVNYNPTTADTYTSTGLTNASGSVELDNITATNISVVVSAALTYTLASPTTGGGSITVSRAPATFTAANIANGANYIIIHRQTFTVSASDVDTSGNTITLTTDTNGDSPSFDTSTSGRHTLVRVTLASGATIPTSSTQIVNSGTYRVLSESSGVIQIEVTEGGGAITFSDQGTDNGSGDLMTLTFETMLAEGTTSGGTGVSESISLADGATYRFKTIHQDTTGGPRKTSEFIDVVGTWSGTSGATYATTVDATNTALTNLWTEPNRIADLSSYQLEDTVIDNTGATITDVNPVEDGADMGGLTFALEGKGYIQINSGSVTKNAASVNGALCALDLAMWGVYQLGLADVMWLASDETIVFNGLSNITIDNVEFDETSGNLLQIYGANIREKDGNPIVSANTTGPIVANVATRGNVGITTTGSGLSSGQANTLDAIKAKTDNLSFTVSNQVDANIQYVNDVQVNGTGANGDEWGP